MSGNESNQMLNLIKELSVYKTLDEEYLAGAQGSVQAAAYAERRRRRREISQEMQSLAAENNSDRD